jgi:prefoldin subunit 5
MSKDAVTELSDDLTSSFLSLEKQISERRSKQTGDSPFQEPISADLPRRQLDRKILESHDATQERIRNISSRVTRMEAYFETITRDIRRLEELQKEMTGHLETMAAGMSASTNKLAIHTEMEEYQWTVVNQSNETLAKVGAALNEHLQYAGAINTRLDWLERLMWALWGVIGAGAAALIPLILKGVGV